MAKIKWEKGIITLWQKNSLDKIIKGELSNPPGLGICKPNIWQLTHIKTGALIKSFRYRKECKKAAEIFYEIMPKEFWEESDFSKAGSYTSTKGREVLKKLTELGIEWIR